jgi:hypothetical protein
MFFGKIKKNACKVTQTALKLMFSSQINQNACKLTQTAFTLAQTVQTDVFRQNKSKCVQTGANNANRCFQAT